MYLDKIKIYAYIIKLILKKSKRTVAVVNEEYNNVWKKYENKELDQSIVYSNLLRMNEACIVVVNGKLKKSVYSNYDSQYTKQFLDLMSMHVSKNDPIVELGCGIGSKLFVLAKNGFTNLKGYELTDYGIKIAKEYAARKKYPIEFKKIDVTKELPLNEIENKTILTYASLEQMKNYMKKVLENIITAKPKKVINFEVNFDDAPLMVKLYFNSRDYQNNLIKYLKFFEKQNIIKIIYNEKLKIQLSPVNQLSCIIWDIKSNTVHH